MSFMLRLATRIELEISSSLTKPCACRF